VDVVRFQAEGRPLIDDRDVEAPWFEWQPSAVPVFFHPTERAISPVELKQLGQKVDALSWTCSQRSAFWVLWRARGQAMPEDTDRRIACATPSRRSARLARSSPASAHASSPSPGASPAKFRSAPRWKRELPSRHQHSCYSMAEVGAGILWLR
jgi:hypothetical protein